MVADLELINQQAQLHNKLHNTQLSASHIRAAKWTCKMTDKLLKDFWQTK